MLPGPTRSHALPLALLLLAAACRSPSPDAALPSAPTPTASAADGGLDDGGLDGDDVAVAALLAQIAHASGDMRHDPGLRGALSLGEKAAPGLRRALLGPDRDLALAAVVVLRIAQPHGWSGAILRDGMRAPDPRVRGWVVDALGFAGLHGAPPEGTVVVVRAALGDPSRLVRAYAANALARLDAADPTPEVVAALVFGLSCDAADLRSEAVDTLGRLGPGAASAVPELARIAADRDDVEGRAGRAAEALVRMGDVGAKALFELIASGDGAAKVRVFGAASRSSALRTQLLPDALAALGDPGPEARAAAARLVGEAGAGRADVAAALVRALDDPSPAVVQAAVRSLGRVGPEAKAAIGRLVKLTTARDRATQEAAIVALGGLGPAAAAAIPVLTRLLSVSHVDAAASLGRIGAAALPVLTGALRHPDRGARERATSALCYLGREAAPAVPALIASLTDPVAPVRSGAARALRHIGPAAARAVPALVERVRGESDEGARAWAIEALGGIGPAAGAAAPALEEALRRDDTSRAAALALVRVGVPGAGVAALAAKAIGLTDGRFVDEEALTALVRLGPRAAAAVPVLRGALEAAPAPTVQSVAWAEALVRIDGSAAALSHLERALAQPEMALGAASGLVTAGKSGAPASSALRPSLRSRRPAEQARAAILLLQVASTDADAQKTLRALLASADPDAQAEAARALDAATLPVDMLPSLTALLANDTPWARRGGAEALGKLGPAARPALPALRRLLFDEASEVRWAALSAVQAIEGR